jgi:hypothetical protein
LEHPLGNSFFDGLRGARSGEFPPGQHPMFRSSSPPPIQPTPNPSSNPNQGYPPEGSLFAGLRGARAPNQSFASRTRRDLFSAPQRACIQPNHHPNPNSNHVYPLSGGLFDGLRGSRSQNRNFRSRYRRGSLCTNARRQPNPDPDSDASTDPLLPPEWGTYSNSTPLLLLYQQRAEQRAQILSNQQGSRAFSRAPKERRGGDEDIESEEE